jgi:hypothetical protein
MSWTWPDLNYLFFTVQSPSASRNLIMISALETNQHDNQIDLAVNKELEGIPAKHHLNAGYVLDPLELAIGSIHVVCPNGDKPYWAIELHESGYECKSIDLFEQSGEHNNSAPEDEPRRARWRRKESGVIVPFARHGKNGA